MVPKFAGRDSGKFDIFSLMFLVSLLVLPALAILRLQLYLNPTIVAAVLFLINLVAFVTYRADKRRAQAKEWRVSEATLHFLELIGGWPAAFVAQRRFRHKTGKLSFQFVYWIIVLIYQAAALDLVKGGIFSQALLTRLAQ